MLLQGDTATHSCHSKRQLPYPLLQDISVALVLTKLPALGEQPISFTHPSQYAKILTDTYTQAQTWRSCPHQLTIPIPISALASNSPCGTAASEQKHPRATRATGQRGLQYMTPRVQCFQPPYGLPHLAAAAQAGEPSSSRSPPAMLPTRTHGAEKASPQAPRWPQGRWAALQHP